MNKLTKKYLHILSSLYKDGMVAAIKDWQDSGSPEMVESGSGKYGAWYHDKSGNCHGFTCLRLWQAIIIEASKRADGITQKELGITSGLKDRLNIGLDGAFDRLQKQLGKDIFCEFACIWQDAYHNSISQLIIEWEYPVNERKGYAYLVLGKKYIYFGNKSD
jgi:hypothetical protein